MNFPTALPIDAVLDDIRAALAKGSAAVLVAPPGAGKTTRVPLALLDAPWLGTQKILVLEPRRIAARAAADRMASTLGERTGETIGLRARLASKVGPRTRIEVVTEGVFTRMILDDPGLDGIGAVLFDEFHERSLDADFGLALALDCQRSLRPDLRLMPMSATLDAARVAALLGSPPVIASEGRAFPVETRYLGRDTLVRIEDQMTAAIMKALATESGSILAFLPGQGEIRRVAERLSERLAGRDVILAPLYGGLDAQEQDRAIAPVPKDRRKVVLATSIAETSITIDGVRIVVDCGLARVPRYEPDVGVTRLETVRVSRAAADQRRGRAGRTEPGVCYRLWDEPQTQSLLPFAEPEIRAADLAGLMLDCAEWGVTDPTRLDWLDPPPAAALQAAREELTALGALDAEGHITAQGRRLRALPLPPRLACMVAVAADLGAERDAADIAAVLVERGIGGNDTDLTHRLDAFRRDRSRRAADMRRLAEGWARTARSGATPSRLVGEGKGGGKPRRSGMPATASPPPAPNPSPQGGGESVAALLALAYPDRLAKARGAPGQFLLANGRGAVLDATDVLARAPYLVVAEMSGTAASSRILLAAPATESEILALAAQRIAERDELTFDAPSASLRARRSRRLDSITLSSEPRPVPATEEAARLFAEGIGKLGIGRLPWSKAQIQLRDRIAFLRTADGEVWPDLSDAALAASAKEWLTPWIMGKSRLSDLGADDLQAAIEALIPWDQRRRIDELAPTHYEAPTGNRHAIDYEGAGAPALHIRVQELFGLSAHPAIARGRLPLTLHLLSPAHRPIQITRDLPGFWAGSWSAVKAEMRGRYPRHPWPDDPASAMPTGRAKPRGT